MARITFLPLALHYKLKVGTVVHRENIVNYTYAVTSTGASLFIKNLRTDVKKMCKWAAKTCGYHIVGAPF